MVLCDHFIFTSAKIKNKSGYQIVSKSKNITSKILFQLKNYLYPTGIDPNIFSESKSLLILEDKVAFIMTKNTGISYDGRFGNIYSHIIIIDNNDFKKFNNDTRPFEKLYNENYSENHSPQLVINPIIVKPNFSCIDIIGITKFEYFFRSILNKKKIAVTDTKNKNLLQNLISLLPPSYRLISFTTLVIMKEKQPKFDLIQIDGLTTSKKYQIINTQKKISIKKKNDTLFDQTITQLMSIINSKNIMLVSKIYNAFENINFGDYKDKLFLSIIITISKSETIYQFNDEMRNDFLMILERAPMNFLITHMEKIQLFLPNEIVEYSVKIKNIKILENYKNETLTYDLIKKMFDKLENDEERLSLFHQLVKNRFNEFTSSGTRLLYDSIGSEYNLIIIYGFLEHEGLHKCVIDTLIKLERDDVKDNFINILLRSSIYENTISLEKLFDPKIFNLKNKNELMNYRKIVQSLFTFHGFYKNSNLQLITITIKQIYDKINTTYYINKSDQIENIDYCVIIDILYAIYNITNYLLYNRESNLKELKYIIEKINNDIKIILNNNELCNQKTKYHFNIFCPIPPTLLKRLFPTFFNYDKTNNFKIGHN